MSVDERDELQHYATLPDLGAVREREVVRAREAIRAAIADIEAEDDAAWHAGHDRAHRWDWLAGYVAAAAALASLLVAVLTVRETYAAAIGVVSLAAIVTSACRSGSKVNAEKAHRNTCPRGHRQENDRG